MHPVPRVNEIAYDVDDDPHAYYIQLAQTGQLSDIGEALTTNIKDSVHALHEVLQLGIKIVECLFLEYDESYM